jgi:YegS/Rv2252/BmrU family lipid kinase
VLYNKIGKKVFLPVQIGKNERGIAMYHIIANPKAGDKKVARLLKRTLKLLKKAGAEYTLHETHYKGHGTQIAEELTQEDGVKLIALGGDGTVHDVLNGIRDVEKCNFGIIPLGTGNDFAASARIPYNVKKAVEVILKGDTKPTDFLEIGGKRCMNVGGVGIDVDVLLRCNKGKRRGKLKYLKSLIISFFKFHGYDLVVECEGEIIEKKVLMVAACNDKQFGGGIKVCLVA